MRLVRFSIAGLMGLVLFVAVAMAALRYASELWVSVLLGLTLMALGVAVLGVIYRREARRASWVGALIFGGGYFVLAFAPWFAAQAAPGLATTKGLDLLYERMNPPRHEVLARFVDGTTGTVRLSGDVVIRNWISGAPDSNARVARAGWFFATPSWAADADSFRRVGHLLAALLLMAVGGLVARRFHATRDAA